MSDTPAIEFNAANIAASWWYGGCSVIPIKNDGLKKPAIKWKLDQTERASAEQVAIWFEQQFPKAGVAVVCGRGSGNLEMLEIEGRASSPESAAKIRLSCVANDIEDVWLQLLESDQGYTEFTPGGGLHILYRISDHDVPGSERVATRPAFDEEYTDQEREVQQQNPNWMAVRVLSETRGQGGYVVVAPTDGSCHKSGIPWRTRTGVTGRFMTITWDQRNRIHAAIRQALHVPTGRELVIQADRLPAPKPARPEGAPPSVAEDFNSKASWTDTWFTEQGWQIHHKERTEIFWTRPGKDLSDGHSASTGYRDDDQDCLYVWSTSTTLPSEVPLTKFMVYSHYRFNDDMSAAARSLRQQGYGPPAHPPVEFADFDLGWNPDAGGQPDGVVAQREQQEHDLESILRDPSGGLVLTDTGYALRLRDLYLDRLKFNSTDSSWYTWQEDIGCWIKDSYSYVDTAAQQVSLATYHWLKSLYAARANEQNEKPLRMLVEKAQSALNHVKLTAMVSRLRTLEHIATATNDFDANLDLLNLRNGTLNLANFEIKAHEPTDMLTLGFNAEYDPEATCPAFFKYLVDVFPDDEVRGYIQRCLGYSLLGRPDERALFLLHGPSGTGKSVFTDVMTHLFGDYATTAPSSTFKVRKQESTVDLHQLRGKRFVASSEMPIGAQLDEELLKRITGGDQIPSRGLYEKYVHWRPQCVIWIATNHLPKLNSDDDAIWRRIRTVPMKTVIRTMQQGETRGFSRYLIQESSGILNWLLDGLREYRRRGSLGEPPAILEDIDKYRNESDTVASWLSEGMATGNWAIEDGSHTLITTLYSNYVTYCQDDGSSHYGKKRFTKRIQAINSTLHLDKRGGQQCIVGLKQLLPR